MIIDKKHFTSRSLNIENTYISDISKLNTKLKRLLCDELSKGNLIDNVTTGWPKDTSIVVSMSKRLTIKFWKPKGVTYRKLNDPRYWVHEYSDGEDYLISGD